uniref:Uncharacterized protein n=1 Tax=Rhizobium rhizogenes TaxID=359 RepID=A0A7S4ZS34_RHIRH|nr:hypothetical protein pC5.7c_514 [Rhizobium rhizogenes]QCL09551.1 hypothetical protein pC5.8a_59 [Rhizobium rhizogenes]
MDREIEQSQAENVYVLGSPDRTASALFVPMGMINDARFAPAPLQPPAHEP